MPEKNPLIDTASEPRARWIWSTLTEPAPANRFTYFRTIFRLIRLPDDGTLRFTADSNARLWINGALVRRKVARYHESMITAEVIDAAQYLRIGTNVVVVLHHNWGGIITFQRTGNAHAGLYLDSAWLSTGDGWRWTQAPEFAEHSQQVVGLIGDPRIRYPLIIDARNGIRGNIHAPTFDDSDWQPTSVVELGPWPSSPTNVETAGQREYAVRPMSVLAAGQAVRSLPVAAEPLEIAGGIRTSKCYPDTLATQRANEIVDGRCITIAGHAGETHYITVDFGLPVHGYPFITLDNAPEGAVLDFAYCEIWRSQYSGELHVDESGWLNPESVVGKGYADRYITRRGKQTLEIPDERTARWLTLHIHFTQTGNITLSSLGIVQSQYPAEAIGSFECGNERINQIVKLCLIHARVTMSDAYVDTPGREDGQWLEDAEPRAVLASRWFGDTALRDLMIRTHAQAQGEDGNLHPFSPSNYPAYPSPFDWSVQWVAMLWDDYMWHGKPERVRRYWTHLFRYWQCVLKLVNHDGLWITPRVLADIRIGVHATERQSSGIVTPWIIERLRWSAQMAVAIGENAQATKWRRIADRMTEAFRREHVVPAGNGNPAHVADRLDPRDARIERGYSQAGQTVAIYTDLVSREDAIADLNYAFPEPDGVPPADVTRWNNPTYSERALKALSHVGLADRSVRHLLERYAQYLPAHPLNVTPLNMQGPYGGPLPEYWVSREDLGLRAGETNTTQPKDDTGSHGWGAVPLLWLHETLLGVQIVEPGGATLRIAPQAAGLSYVQGQTATPKGIVWVSWDPQRQRLETTIPDEVTAFVIAPEGINADRFRPIEVSGEVLATNGRTITIVGPGRYVFQTM
jgi:hypothetical protein